MDGDDLVVELTLPNFQSGDPTDVTRLQEERGRHAAEGDEYEVPVQDRIAVQG